MERGCGEQKEGKKQGADTFSEAWQEGGGSKFELHVSENLQYTTYTFVLSALKNKLLVSAL